MIRITIKTGVRTGKIIKKSIYEEFKNIVIKKVPNIDPRAIAELIYPIDWDLLLNITDSVINPKYDISTSGQIGITHRTTKKIFDVIKRNDPRYIVCIPIPKAKDRHVPILSTSFPIRGNISIVNNAAKFETDA